MKKRIQKLNVLHTGIFMAVFYNLVAGWIGGLEITLKDLLRKGPVDEF